VPGFATGGNSHLPLPVHSGRGFAPSVSSYGTSVTSPSSDGHSALAEENFQTSFQLFTHDYENVYKAIVICKFTNQPIKFSKKFQSFDLVKSTVQSKLWCINDVTVHKGWKYAYKISYSDVGKLWTSQSSQEEDKDRCITQSAYHRDIFCSGKKPLTASQMLSGWKVFVIMMLQSMSNKSDLDLMLKEYRNREIQDLTTFSRRELADHVVQKFYETSNGKFNVEQAVFVVYVLSTLLTSFEDWQNCKMKQNESKCVLSALQSVLLENHLPDHMRSDVILTLTHLVRRSFASATWLNYVHHCFPVLTGEELYRNVKYFKEDFTDTKRCAAVVLHVWLNREARPTGFVLLLADVIRKASLGRELLFAYKELLTDKYENVQCIGCVMKEKVLNLIKACNSVKRFHEVLSCARDVLDADLLSYLDLTHTFEKAVFSIVSKSDVTDEDANSLLSLASKSPLFVDQQALGLLDALSNSKSLPIHKLLLTLMKETKFSSSVSDDDVIKLISNWLDAFSKMSSTGMSMKLQHEYLWQLVSLPVVEKDETLKKQVGEKVKECCHCLVKETVKCAALRDIEEIVTSCSDCMDELRQDVIDSIIQYTKKTANWSNDSVEIFKRLVLSHDLAIFLANDILKLLEVVASSKAYVIYSLFFTILNSYFHRLSAKEVENVVDKWILIAKEIFSKKAASDPLSSSGKRKLLYLTQLYEFSQAALSGSCMLENEDISNKLRTFIKSECSNCLALHDELLEMCDANRVGGGLSLLERHLCEIQREKLPNPDEVFTTLQRRLQRKRERQAYFLCLMLIL